MQVIERSSPITTSHVFEKTEFKIAASPHAFKILSSSLYSNKIKAVVRELSTNAVDAHIYVNKHDTPFHVHLPNTLEPFFSIRDYGPGLSDEEVLSLYTTYFSSGHNKISSNNYCGYFGLGSKSFFAYTDTANITSYYNGVKTDYTLVIENGFPKVIKLPQVLKTDESSGLFVKFGVAPEDTNKFILAAESIYPYFNLKPKVVGNKAYNSNKEVKYIYKTKDWGIREHDSQNYNVIMGNISYPLDLYKFEAVPVDKNVSVDIFVNIGDCDITPSRESLSYTQKTIDYISQRLKDIADSATQYLNNKISSCKTLWDARLLTKNCTMLCENKQDYFLYNLISGHNIDLQWNNQPCTTTLQLNTTIIRFSYHGKKNGQITPTLYINNNDIQFYENDVKLGAISRCKELVETVGTNKTIYLCTFKTEEEKKEFCNILGCDLSIFHKISDLPKPVREYTPRDKSIKKNYKIFKFATGSYSSQNTYWQTIDVDFTTSKPEYYVELDRWKFLNQNNIATKPYYLEHYIKELNAVGCPINLYGIRKEYIKLAKKAGWINLLDKYDNLLLESFNKGNYSRLISIYKELDQYYKTNFWRQLSKTDHWKKLDINHPIFKLMSYYVEIKDLYDTNTILSIANQNNKLQHIDIIHSDILLKEYPMLQCWLDNYSCSYLNDVINYIRLVDKSKKTRYNILKGTKL